MNKPDNRFLKIVDIIKKDSAINNSIDAVEQLCLLLLTRYLYEIGNLRTYSSEVDTFFEKLFNFDDSAFNKITLHEEFKNSVNEWLLYNRNIAIGNKEVLNDLLESIPLRIRSEKVLYSVIDLVKHINFNDSIENHFDELLFIMIKESKAAGTFYSPMSLIDTLVSVTKPLPSEDFYDPAMGTGRTFVAIRNHLIYEHDYYGMKASGKDISPFACLIAVLNLLFNGVDIKNISISDSLLTIDNKKYNLILSAVPFGVLSEISRYEYAYNGYSGNLEAMFLKHTMEKLANGGRAAIVVPDGMLSNNSQSLITLRKELLGKFNLHSILSLPNNTLAPYSNVKISVLFFDNGLAGRDIWFYDLAHKTLLNPKNVVTDNDYKEFINAYEERKSTKFSCLIEKSSLDESETYDLSIKLPSTEVKESFIKRDAIESLLDMQRSFSSKFESYVETSLKEINVTYERTVTIKNIANLRTGLNLNKAELSKKGNYPVYGGNGIIGFHSSSNRQGNTIIIGKVGMYCGNVHFSEQPFWLTSNAISLELIDGEVYEPYLTYVLKCLDLNKLATGTVQQFVSIKKIKEIEIQLPSYDEQVKLSEFFRKLEHSCNSMKNLVKDFSHDIAKTTSALISEKVINT